MSWAAVAVDAVGPAGGGGAGTSIGGGLTSALTWTHVVTGSNTVIYIACSVGVANTGHTASNFDDEFVIGAVTYNSVAASLVTSIVHSGAGHTGYVALYRLINPTTGSNTVSVSFTDTNSQASDAMPCGSVSLTGVDQTTPESNITSATGNSTTPSVNVTSAVNNMVLDVVGVGSAITSSNQTLQWKKNVNSNTAAGNGAGSTAAGAASVTMSYAVTSDSWAILGVNVNAVGAGGGTLPPSRALMGVGQ